MKKHWYDYLWIVSLTYLILGFFNILFALSKERKAIVIVIAGAGSCSGYWGDASGSPAKQIFRNG